MSEEIDGNINENVAMMPVNSDSESSVSLNDENADEEDNDKLLNDAILSLNKEKLKFLLSYDFNFNNINDTVMSHNIQAYYTKDIDIFKMVLNRTSPNDAYPHSEYLIIQIIDNNDIEYLKLLIKKYRDNDINIDTALIYTAYNCKLDLLKLLLEKKIGPGFFNIYSLMEDDGENNVKTLFNYFNDQIDVAKCLMSHSVRSNLDLVRLLLSNSDAINIEDIKITHEFLGMKNFLDKIKFRNQGTFYNSHDNDLLEVLLNSKKCNISNESILDLLRDLLFIYRDKENVEGAIAEQRMNSIIKYINTRNIDIKIQDIMNWYREVSTDLMEIFLKKANIDMHIYMMEFSPCYYFLQHFPDCTRLLYKYGALPLLVRVRNPNNEVLIYTTLEKNNMSDLNFICESILFHSEDSEAFDKGLITYIKCLPHYREENSLRNINKALELNHRDNEFVQARFNIFVESLNNIKESTVCTKLYFSGIKGDDILYNIASFLNWYDIKNLFLTSGTMFLNGAASEIKNSKGVSWKKTLSFWNKLLGINA